VEILVKGATGGASRDKRPRPECTYVFWVGAKTQNFAIFREHLGLDGSI
jgi:hypothetical protein